MAHNMQQGSDPLLDGQAASSASSLSTRGWVPRSSAAAKGISAEVRVIVSCCAAKCCEASEAGSPEVQFSGGSSRHRLFHDQLLGAIRRLRVIQRIGVDPVFPCSHLQCACPLGPQWGARLLGAAHGGVDQANLDGNGWELAYRITDPRDSIRGPRASALLPLNNGPLLPRPKRWTTSKQRGGMVAMPRRRQLPVRQGIKLRSDRWSSSRFWWRTS